GLPTYRGTARPAASSLARSASGTGIAPGGGDDRESDGICGSFLRLDPHHFEQDSAHLGEERAHAVAFVPIDELDVRARDAALEAALVGALDVARANRDAPDVRLRAAQDLELAALGRSGDEAAAAVVAAPRNHALPGHR